MKLGALIQVYSQLVFAPKYRERSLLRHSFVTLLTIFSLTQQAYSSETKNHTIKFSLGFTKNLVRDSQASPLAYQGLSPFFQIGYSKLSQSHQHQILLNYNKCNLESATDHNANFYKFYIQYRFIKQINFISREKVQIYLGGKWDYNSSERVYNYSDQISSELFRHHFSSLYVDFFIEHTPSKSIKIQYEIAVPFLTYMIHSGYSYSSPENLISNHDYSVLEFIGSGKFTSIHDFRCFQTKLNLQKKVSKKYSLFFEYHFLYYEYPFPRLLRFASNRFCVGIGWNF